MNDKKRKAYTYIESALNLKIYGVVILLGLRKTGKTTILEQLARNMNGHYVDFRKSADSSTAIEEFKNAFKVEQDLILLDEIGYLPDFDTYFSSLEKDIKEAGKQVVITSSSYGTLKQLATEKLGGGRSYVVELFPLDFEEYLYFSGKIDNYTVEYTPIAEDVSNFYRLKNVPAGMDFIIDEQFMRGTFKDAEAARLNQDGGHRNLYMTEEQYITSLDVIAYSLNVPLTLRKFKNQVIGVQEFGANSGIDFSESLIGIAKLIAQGTASAVIPNTDIPTLTHIIQALYHNGFLFIDLVADETGKQCPDSIHHDLNLVQTFPDLEQQLRKYNFSVISPLLYTRLLLNLEGIAQMAYTSDNLDGELYELAVKSEVVYKEGFVCNHCAYKYQQGKIQVNVYHPRGLLLEATVSHKIDSEHSVDKVYRDMELTRVLTMEDGYKYQYTGLYHKIAYPQALLMLSNRSVYRLEANKVTDTQTAANTVNVVEESRITLDNPYTSSTQFNSYF